MRNNDNNDKGNKIIVATITEPGRPPVVGYWNQPYGRWLKNKHDATQYAVNEVANIPTRSVTTTLCTEAA